MQTPASLKKAEFNDKISQLTASVKASYENGTYDQDRPKLQNRLDRLAEKYQHDENLGALRHKLYDAQALVYYLGSDDAKALEFADAAEEVNGAPTSISTQVRGHIAKEGTFASRRDEAGVDDSQPRKKIEGWMIVLVIGVIIGICYNVYAFFSGINTEHTITPDIESAYPGITALVNVENSVAGIAAICGVALLYLIFQRRKLARYFGIFFFAAIALYSVADLSIATNMFANNPDAAAAVNQGAGDIGRTILLSIIWGAYLIFSKRAKATLVR